MKKGLAFSAIALMLCVSLPAYADHLSFRAALSGAQQVPAGIDTAARGTFRMVYDEDMSAATFDLNVFGGVNIAQAHIHCAQAGANGPVIAFLFGPGLTDSDGSLSGGVLTNASIFPKTADECGVPINNIASLYNAMRQGLTYINVHTAANPAGETRGQVFQ